MEREQVVMFYHQLGFKQNEILLLLTQNHGFIICKRTLQRILKAKNLRRWTDKNNMIKIASFINRQLSFSGRQHGYRFMQTKCTMAGFSVSREVVRIILSVLDPEGVSLRRRKRLVRRRYYAHGPNHVWHLDSYDKLSPYGIGINDCVDGFSRYIVWMEASYTNSDPKVVAGYFVNAIVSIQGCPRVVRADRGTENISVRRIQLGLRSGHPDDFSGNRSFLFGKSTANTRIESMWGILRKQNAEFWIELFHFLQSEGLFEGSLRDKELIRFCFLRLIQAELDEFVIAWNMHIIRRSRNDTLVHGRPFLMYTQCELYGVQDNLVRIESRSATYFQNEYLIKDDLPCDADMFDLCKLIMDDFGWSDPKDAEEATILYHGLRDVVCQLIDRT